LRLSKCKEKQQLKVIICPNNATLGIVHISCLKGCLRVTNCLQEIEADCELLIIAAGKTEGGVGVIAGSVAPDLIIPGQYSDGQVTESSLCPDVPPKHIFKKVCEMLKQK
jgi:hypothetical protein